LLMTCHMPHAHVCHGQDAVTNARALFYWPSDNSKLLCRLPKQTKQKKLGWKNIDMNMNNSWQLQTLS